MVDNILSDNTGHRRFLFEEASGITKYKQRKKEALSKLDATEGDLTRLQDIVFEIERELRSLARQVGKARRYQRLRDEVRDLDLALTGDSISALRAREKQSHEDWQEEATRREGAAAELDRARGDLNDQKLALLEVERELTTAQGGLKDREDARQKAETQVVLLRERAAGLTRRRHEASEEATRMRERLAETAAREDEAKQKLAATRAQRETAQDAAETAEASLDELEARAAREPDARGDTQAAVARPVLDRGGEARPLRAHSRAADLARRAARAGRGAAWGTARAGGRPGTQRGRVARAAGGPRGGAGRGARRAHGRRGEHRRGGFASARRRTRRCRAFARKRPQRIRDWPHCSSSSATSKGSPRACAR